MDHRPKKCTDDGVLSRSERGLLGALTPRVHQVTLNFAPTLTRVHDMLDKFLVQRLFAQFVMYATKGIVHRCL